MVPCVSTATPESSLEVKTMDDDPTTTLVLPPTAATQGPSTTSSSEKRSNLHTNSIEDNNDNDTATATTTATTNVANNNGNNVVVRLLRHIHRTWVRGTEAMRHGMTYALVVVAKLAANNPWCTIVFFLGLAVGMLTAGLRTNFRMELNMMTLFTPTSSRTLENRKWAIEGSRLPYVTKLYVPLQIIVHANGKNVINYEGIERIFDVYDMVLQNHQNGAYNELCGPLDTTATNSSDDQTIAPNTGDEYTDFLINGLAGNVAECDIQSVARFWNDNRTWFEEQVPVGDDVTRFLLPDTFPDNTTVDQSRIFGMLKALDDGVPLSAEALFFEINIPITRIGTIERIKKYTDGLVANVTDLRDSWKKKTMVTTAANGEKVMMSTDYRVEFVIDFSGIPAEFRDAILADFPLLPVIFMIMLAFTCFVFWRPDRVHSRLFLALGSVVTVLLSLATAFGLMFVLGIPYTVVTNVLPYIIFGVGLDDTYIIHGAFERTDPSRSIVERVVDTFEEIGLSIIMTSMTTTLAFGLGCISSVPAIQYLCLYAFPTICIDFVYQVTFFVALLVLDERRVQAKRLDCCCCWVASSSDMEEKEEERDTTDDMESGAITTSCVRADSDSSSGSSNGTNSVCASSAKSVLKVPTPTASAMNQEEEQCRQKRSPGMPTASKERWWWCSGQKIMEHVTELLIHPAVGIAVLVAFVGVLAGCGYSATKLKQEFSFYDLLPDYSSTKTYLAAKENYGGINGEMYMFFRGLNQSDPAVQDQMVDYIDQIDAIDHIEVQPFCWVRDVRAMINDPDAFLRGMMADPATARVLQGNTEVMEFLRGQASLLETLSFNQVLDLLLSQPLIKVLYEPHLRRSEVTGDVIVSRCQIMIRNLDYTDVTESVQLLHAQNYVTEHHPINQDNAGFSHAFLYKDLFHLWEFFDVAINELKFTAFTGIMTVSVFGFVFVPHWSAVLYILPFMCVLYIDLLGLFQLAGLSINVLTYVVLVVSVGLLVDFIMHVLLRYFESTKVGRKEKVKDTLNTLGASILVGGVSTFIGTVPLLFSQSMVFRTMCSAFFSMISLGVSHGLILLPVLLSMFGAETAASDSSSSNSNDTSINQKDSEQVISPTSWGRVLHGGVAQKFFKNGRKGDDHTSDSSGISTKNSEGTLTPTSQGKHKVRRTTQRKGSAASEKSDYTIAQMCRSSDTFEQFEIFV